MKVHLLGSGRVPWNPHGGQQRSLNGSSAGQAVRN
jgi:hypothetical protein